MQNTTNSIQNDSLIHPPGFYIIGLISLTYTNVYVIFLAVIYVITSFTNCFVICIICIDHHLHVPKFIAVGNLAVVDLVLSTSLIPSMIKIYLLKDNFIDYTLCFMQMYMYYAFLTLESFSIAILAFDRLIAICFPLRQNSINTTTTMTTIITSIWILTLGTITISTLSMTYLSFCNSVQVNSYFCDYAPVFRLACNDNSLQWTFATVLSSVCIFVPLSFIVLSYTCILFSVFQMKSVESRFKALTTCTEHLILVAIFYIPILVIFMIGLFRVEIKPDVRIVGLSLSSCIPPCTNPIIYSLKTKELKSRVRLLFQRTFNIQRHSVHPLHKK
ncbi:olfactory receptor 2AT4-like [Pygocentrus nattereri]|uniref:G-protein coupled receptors family 1 profile domain-containing protein n=1 Tax=Pygocentrus nattereri TaxID=42514 RepID=A0A3B4CZT8_PYGNA|nr:olfactory receptor 2AT4-like [Pygocentrus nattereri]